MCNTSFSEYSRKIMKIKENDGLSANGFYTHWFCPIEKHLIPFFGAMNVEDIKYTTIAEYFISKKDYAQGTLKIHFSALNYILRLAKYDGLITQNPCQFYKLKAGRKQEERSYYSSEQIDMILKYCYIHRFGLDVFVMLKTGVSRAELLGIQWRDIMLDDKLISINKDAIVNYTDGKKDLVSTKNQFRTRLVAIDDETVAFLRTVNRRVAVECDGVSKVVVSDFLIHNNQGSMCNPRTWSRRHYDVFMRDMQEFYSERGVYMPAYSSHCLRHSCASKFLNAGCAPAAIIAQMGWADYSMLNRVYGHRDIRVLREQLGI